MDEDKCAKCRKEMNDSRAEYKDMHRHVTAFLEHKRTLENELEKMDKRIKDLEREVKNGR